MADGPHNTVPTVARGLCKGQRVGTIRGARKGLLPHRAPPASCHRPPGMKLLFRVSQPCPQLKTMPLALPSEWGHPEWGQKGQTHHYNQTLLCPELGLTCLLL